MSLRFLFTAALLTSLAVVGQTVSNGTSFPTSIPPGPGLQGNSGYVLGPTGNGQVAAPTVTFASPVPAAGISTAGIAGISDHAPLQQGVQSTLVPPTVVYTSAPPTVYYAGQPAANPGAASGGATESSASDLAASIYAGSSNAAGMNASLSLGEVAVQNKTHNGAQHARSYTNADVQKLLSRRGVGNVMEAANRTPSNVPAPPQNRQEAATSNQNAGQPVNGSMAQSTPTTQAGNSGLGQSATIVPPTNNSPQNAETNSAGNTSTTPQIRQTQPHDTQENSQQLPATSTILPLLGLIGLATSGVGFWYRKSRK